MSLSRTQIVDWLYRCGDIFTKESDFLTGLDREIGDADHGLNMHRGFSKVVEKLPSIADKDIGFILKNNEQAYLTLKKLPSIEKAKELGFTSIQYLYAFKEQNIVHQLRMSSGEFLLIGLLDYLNEKCIEKKDNKRKEEK